MEIAVIRNWARFIEKAVKSCGKKTKIFMFKPTKPKLSIHFIIKEMQFAFRRFYQQSRTVRVLETPQ